MIKRDSVSKSCDVYSYGIFLWELVTQQQPFSDVRPQFLVMNQVLEGKVGNYLFHLNTFFDSCYSLRHHCRRAGLRGATDVTSLVKTTLLLYSDIMTYNIHTGTELE